MPADGMTFEDLGIPFKLFEADADDCELYRGVGICSICSGPGHLFAVRGEADTTACYACLRAGRFGYPKQTEPGLTPESLTELERTPDHDDQGPWPACCRLPMIFLGETDDKLVPTGPDAIMMGDYGDHGRGWRYHLYRCQTCDNVSALGWK